jgi:hypothetical protein
LMTWYRHFNKKKVVRLKSLYRSQPEWNEANPSHPFNLYTKEKMLLMTVLNNLRNIMTA